MTLSQETRSIRLAVPEDLEVKLAFRKLVAYERVSSLFEFRVLFVSETPDLKLADLMAKPFCVELHGESAPVRFFHGYCAEARFVGREDQRHLYEMVLRPALWFATRGAFIRVFHGQTADAIISSLLGLQDEPRIDIEMVFDDPPQQRLYCVQYFESNFNFVSRLLEQEGIFYFFEHAADGHKMVITNRGKGVDRPYDALGPVTFFTQGSRQNRPKVHLDEWSAREVLGRSDGSVMMDYNYEDRSAFGGINLTNPAGHIASSEDNRFPGPARTAEEADRYSKFWSDGEVALRSTRQASGNAMGLCPGKTLILDGHPDTTANRGYSIIETRHYIEGDIFHAGSGAPGAPRIDVMLIPDDVFFRPRITTPRPRVYGPQTAIVAADDEAATEEIAVDALGRVRVNFFWGDQTFHNGIRHGKLPMTSTWIRVAQIWAGQNWGALFTPRVGQEVVVDFEDGDPDRPLITGSVYNGVYKPPYSLPGEKTKSTIKSNSSKGGNGFNELRFEDKKGQEELFMHAQSNMNVVVRNSRTTSIGNEERRVIKNRRYTEIKDGNEDKVLEKGSMTTWLDKGDVTMVLQEGGRKTGIHKDDVLSVRQGDHTIEVQQGNQKIEIKLGKQEVTAMQSIELKVATSSIKIDPIGVTIKAPIIKLEGTLIQIQGSAMTQIKGGGLLMEEGGLVRVSGGLVLIN